MATANISALTILSPFNFSTMAPISSSVTFTVSGTTGRGGVGPFAQGYNQGALAVSVPFGTGGTTTGGVANVGYVG